MRGSVDWILKSGMARSGFIFVIAPAVSLMAGSTDSDLFEMKVRPILARNCYGCHAKTALGGLRLDSRESAMKGGNDGPVIVPGKPGESLLIQAVRRTHERFKMPPTGKLNDEEIATLVN